MPLNGKSPYYTPTPHCLVLYLHLAHIAKTKVYSYVTILKNLN